MKLGFARKDITPGSPVSMAGYLVNRISEGVHDKLYARALYFEDSKENKESTMILQVDLLNLDQVCLEKIYSGLSNNFPSFNKNKLLVCATHTHSGIGGIFDTERGINQELLPLLGKSNPDLVDLVVKQSIAAITEAAANCVETTLRISRGTIQGLGKNRRRADIPCDNSLFVMEFFRIDRKKILLYNLCCHPTVLNEENRLLSADFPGAVAGKLEGIPGSYDMVVFINGSAGDMSTRFTRKESSFDECNMFASMIIKALSGITNGVFFPIEKIDLQYRSVSLKRASVPEPHTARENLHSALERLKELKNQNADIGTLKKAATLVEGAQISLFKGESAQKPDAKAEKSIETGILKINNITIICSPFELFSSLTLSLKEKKQIECFGYVNCLEGYLADCDAWDNLDYEALSSDFAKGEGERYIELVSDFL